MYVWAGASTARATLKRKPLSAAAVTRRTAACASMYRRVGCCGGLSLGPLTAVSRTAAMVIYNQWPGTSQYGRTVVTSPRALGKEISRFRGRPPLSDPLLLCVF